MSVTKISIVIPVYNDWKSLNILLSNIASIVADDAVHVSDIIIVNDSPIEFTGSMFNISPIRLHCLTLTRNMGHQRAIAIGLCYVKDNLKLDNVIVMDADGEDKPEQILNLCNAQKNDPEFIHFARRTKRNENSVFKLFYVLYKGLFKILTGHKISYGNFSIIPSSLLPALVNASEIFNHYSGSIKKLKLPFKTVGLERGKRYAGSSKMNFTNLVLHGLSAISIYLDMVGVRLMIFFFVLMILLIIAIIAVVVIKFFTDQAIPGWASTTALGLLLLFFQAFFICFFLVFIILSNRNIKNFIPIHDYKSFIQKTKIKGNQ